MSAADTTAKPIRLADAPLRRLALVLAVAYVLVLQALLGGMASGAHAAGFIAIDEFGRTLCLNSHGAPDAPGESGRHTPDCCLTGCQAAPAAALPPPLPAMAALPAGHHAGPTPPPRAAGLARAPERSPRHTRAPPAA
ncbi:hypothetical protein [Ancylobacter sp. IITR112]|uniref:hypothetical protein n=1 Tax=Ancylobacter sp. IITR112 TaxID=3138073 RepID=UPI00352B326C